MIASIRDQYIPSNIPREGISNQLQSSCNLARGGFLQERSGTVHKLFPRWSAMISD